MNYYNRQYGGNGGGRRPRQQQPRNNVQGGYASNRGSMKENVNKRNDRDPDYQGVMNVEINGIQHTFFVSGWWNENGSMGLSFKDVNEANQGGGRPQQRGNYRQGGNQRQPQRGYDRGYQEDYQQPEQPRQNGGAMSRARPIPQPSYADEPAPEYPDGPQYPDEVIPY